MEEFRKREKVMYSGNWKCFDCGTVITELPFRPDDESNIRCKPCYMKHKGFK